MCILCESKKGVCPSALNAVVGETTDIILYLDKPCAHSWTHHLSMVFFFKQEGCCVPYFLVTSCYLFLIVVVPLDVVLMDGCL